MEFIEIASTIEIPENINKKPKHMLLSYFFDKETYANHKRWKLMQLILRSKTNEQLKSYLEENDQMQKYIEQINTNIRQINIDISKEQESLNLINNRIRQIQKEIYDKNQIIRNNNYQIIAYYENKIIIDENHMRIQKNKSKINQIILRNQSQHYQSILQKITKSLKTSKHSERNYVMPNRCLGKQTYFNGDDLLKKVAADFEKNHQVFLQK